MSRVAMMEFVDVPGETLDELEALMDQTRALTAWQRAQPYGPLGRWAPGRARRTASRIAAGAGEDRLSAVLDWLNWRHDRQNPERHFRALFSRLQWSPPVALLPEIDGLLAALREDVKSSTRSDLLAFKGWSLATLRDFPAAHEAMARALDLTPDAPWIHVQHSSVLELEDRYEEALVAAKRGLESNPNHRSSIFQTVDCLVHLGRDDEAIQLLHNAHEATEHGAFALRLQALYSEREDHARALWCLEQVERLMPMLPEASRKWLAGRRADFLYMAGDIDGCLEWCDRKGEGFQKMVAEKLRRPGARERKRVRLDVPFIRQHNMTCAPATLASLAKFWGRDHDHLEIADAICYNGTPWHKERVWAETHGFTVREFRFTREILIPLIDRGIPFTLSTSAVTSAHLQACIGYDDRADVVLLRDPTQRHFGEMAIDGLIETHPVQGPRCTVLIPHEDAGRLAGLIFPDEGLYDARHQLALALEKHDRWKAEKAVSTLRAIAPDHPFTVSGELELMAYLGHRARQLELIDRLTGRFPDHAPLQFRRLGVLQQLGDREGSHRLLETMAGKAGADPIFASELGEWLLEDARQLPLAGHYLRRAARLKRGDGQPLENLARWHTKSGNFREAARLRRYASNLSATWEPYARAYFDSCRTIGRTEEGLDFLRQRTKDLGRSNSAPWLTYATALDHVQRDQEAKGVLEEALAAFPDDGKLKLEAARMMIAWGDAERATGMRWIEEARGQVSESSWLRHRAGSAIYLGDRPLAIRLWKSVIEREPLALDAWQTLARLIAEEQGETEAIAFVKEGTRQHPRHTGLWALLAHWQNGPGESLPALDRLLELDPDDNWARRERAGARFTTGDAEGGLADAREALERNRRDPVSHGVLASLLHRQDQHGEALAFIREALLLDVDYTFAIDKLMEWSLGQAAQQEAIAFIGGEMKRQVSNGDCVPVYQANAWTVLAPPDLMGRLQGFCAERPDLWQTWVARLDQALRMDLSTEALFCANHLAAAFPLMPRTWMEVAKVRHAAGDMTAELEALRKALELAPAWDVAARRYSERLERVGRHDEAEEVLRRAVRHEPLVPANHGLLADLLSRRGKKNEAWQSLLNGVKAGPYYSWAWGMLAQLATELGRKEEFQSLLESHGASHGHNTAWWAILVDLYQELKRPEDALQAARSGLEIQPKDPTLRDNVAIILTEMGRYDEAVDACSAAPGEAAPSTSALGRRAWVLMKSGDGPAALREMEALLEREPDYAWGWQQISEWYHARRNWEGLSKSTKQWARFNPNQAIAHGFAGVAAEELQQHEQAKRSYERAFLLDPGYEFAGRKLIQLQIKSSELETARETLQTLRHYSPGPWVECDAIHLALANRWEAQALEMGVKLSREVTDAGPLAWLNEEFTKHRLGTRWRQQQQALILEGGDLSPALLSSWADQFRDKSSLAAAAKRLRKFNIPEAARNAAWEGLLRAAFESRNFEFIKTWVRKERARFRNDRQLWNVTGELLIDTGRSREAAKWLGDWEQRPELVGAHTLVNLTSALDTVKGPHASSEIRMTGIGRFRNDRNTLLLRAAQAAHLASTDRVGEAEEMLAPVEDIRMSPYYVGLAALGRSIVAASRDDTGAAEDHYRTAIEKLRPWPKDPAMHRHLTAAQKTLATKLPWTSGKRRRLAKGWGDIPRPSRWRFLGTSGLTIGLSLVVILVLIASIAAGVPHVAVILGIVIARALGSSNKK